jgi:nucleoside-diphosphate-sugar epimerase
VTDQFKDNMLLTGGAGFVGQTLIKNLNSSVKLLSQILHLKDDAVVCDLERQSFWIDVIILLKTFLNFFGYNRLSH